MTYTVPGTAAGQSRLGGLDGLRAIAVALVLVYHFFPRALPGGFLGVDMFFAISGFLITTLLLRESRAKGRFSLLNFWRRRARRLLPALGLVLLVCTTAALLIGGDVLTNIAIQIGGAALFVSNWAFIFTGSDYFGSDTPELYRNTWSLGVEEQFYLLLPLLLLALLLVRRVATRVLVLSLLGLGSAALMWIYADQGMDATRIYFGTDSHLFGLLLGAAMACAIPGPGKLEAEPKHMLLRQWTSAALVAGGLATIGWLALTLEEGSTTSFQGGMQLATLAALVVVGAATRHRAIVGRVLDVQPLRWIGERSYAIYLWHWPILVLATAALGSWAKTPWGAWTVGLGGIILTLAISALSFTFLEMPVRRIGFRRSMVLFFRPRLLSSGRRVVAATLGLLLLVTIPSTAWAMATAPTVSSGEAAVERGKAALAVAEARMPEMCWVTPSPLADREEEPLATGEQITAIGDSVMLASAPELRSTFPGIAVDATVSRSMGAGAGIVADQSAGGALRDVIVLGLGTNGPVPQEQLQAVLSASAGRDIVLVNAHAVRDWIPGVNQTLADFAAQHRGVVLANWDSAIAEHPDYLAGDGIHPGSSGGQIYADTVKAALEELRLPQEDPGFEPSQSPCD